MTKLTDLETKVLKVIREQALDDYSSSVKEVSNATQLDVKTVKGVVGSLVKKNLVMADHEERGGRMFLDLFPLDKNGNVVSYACDDYDYDTYMTEAYGEEL